MICAAFILGIIVGLCGCAYDGPRIDLNVGFMGATVGIGIGGNPPAAIALPKPEGLRK